MPFQSCVVRESGENIDLESAKFKIQNAKMKLAILLTFALVVFSSSSVQGECLANTLFSQVEQLLGHSNPNA